jgi:hypothetical protein
VSVGVEGERDGGVAETLLDDLGMLPGRHEESGVAVAKVVKANGRLVYHTVRYIVEQLGKTPSDIQAIVRHSRLWAWLDGEHDPESFRVGLIALGEGGGPRLDVRRFLTGDGELLHIAGRTYAFTNQWGTNALPTMESLRAAFPEAGIHYEASSQA